MESAGTTLRVNRMRIRNSRQRFYASLLSVGAAFLLFRTFSMMLAGQAFKIFVPWVSALLVAESLLDLACLIGSVRWIITPKYRMASVALRLCVAVIVLHAVRVLVYVLGRTGPWINFDMKPIYRAYYVADLFWVYFAGIGSALSLLAVVVVWQIWKRVRMKKSIVCGCLVVCALLVSSCNRKTVTKPEPAPPPPPELTVSLTSLLIGYDPGCSGTFDVTSNTDWTVTDDADWLTVSPDSGSNDGTVIVTVSIGNPLTSERSATVTVSAEGVSDQTVAVTQATRFSSMLGNDGRVYYKLKIGDQWWMAENLRETQYSSGDTIPVVTGAVDWSSLTTGALCAYDNSETHADTYGYLYNGYALSDARNIAVEGWHVPTDEDWKKLEMTLGMSRSEADNAGYRGTNEGSKLAGHASLWVEGSLTAVIVFGASYFNALPAGYRYLNGNFGNVGYYAYFWTATAYETDYAWYRSLSYEFSVVRRTHINKKCGFSVRLVQDE